ncbi:MAG: sugar phosphate isomerase/epimerase [Clostridia bacterium]|nr:sugar phosphate isomerase/epimerase [Clostridia bacterium]
MVLKFGVDTFIWSENFLEKDIWVIERAKNIGFEAIDFAIAHPDTFPTEKVKIALERAQIEPVTSTTLDGATNIISPDPAIRANGVKMLKKLVDINVALGSKIIGGVCYAGWGCLSGKPRTEQEWEWSVNAMREVAQYAKNCSDLKITVEPVNRFETHFINIAADGVKYCKDVGTGNMGVHLDTFHMIREETSFTEAVEVCGKYLGYIHVCENNRGIPGTGLVPFKEFFAAVIKNGYSGPLVIESFDPSFEELNRNCAIWRKFAETGEELAEKGLKNLKAIAETC